MKRVGDGKGVFHGQEAGSVKIKNTTRRKLDYREKVVEAMAVLKMIVMEDSHNYSNFIMAKK